jgi:hypothetical protein
MDLATPDLDWSEGDAAVQSGSPPCSVVAWENEECSRVHADRPLADLMRN